MSTATSEFETSAAGGSISPKARAATARKARLRKMSLEKLEERTLMSTLPAPVPLPQPINLSKDAGNQSSPQVAIDRYNTNKLAAVWVRNDPTLSGPTKVIVEGAYSNNGGQSWVTFSASPGVVTDPNSDPNNPQPFAQVTDPSVSFDAANDFYVTVSEHSADNGSGAIVIGKFDFNGTSPSSAALGGSGVIHEWASGIDQLYRPALKVDDNLATFTDPTTGQTQTDALTNNVYVAWGTNTIAQSQGADTGVYNVVQLVGSHDGGNTFSNPVVLNDSKFTTGGSRNSAPQIAISQGRLADTTTYGPADTGVSGGLVTTVWDEYVHNQNSPGQITSAGVANGVNAFIFKGAGGPLLDAIKGANSAPDTPVPSSFTIPNVQITDPAFILSDLSVKISLLQPDDRALSAVLLGPHGISINLFNNREDEAGNDRGNYSGLTGANMGVIVNGTTIGQQVGTTLDDNAARGIQETNATGPYIGTFKTVSGGLNQLKGLSGAALSGPWTLVITEHKDYGTPNPAPQLLNWSLNFSSGLTVGANKPVAAAAGAGSRLPGDPVAGNATGAFPTASAADPLGIGPSPVIASDNSLGSFSMHEGALYVAYVTPGGTPTDNTDIALSVSTDGGQSWKVTSKKVNQDVATVDGYTEADGNHGRPQFMPAAAVDPVTGTLVLSWRDARADAARARVATYVTTSTNGGTSFSATSEVYANPSQTATDAITGATAVIGPRADNQSPGNPLTDAAFGYGERMGLAVYGGKIFPVWSGNFNPLATYQNQDKLNIYTNPMTYLTGPRVVASTMGPVGVPDDTLNTTKAADGTPLANTIALTLDKPVDPATSATQPLVPPKSFQYDSTKTGDPNSSTATPAVEVFYHGVNPTDGFIPLLVTSIRPAAATEGNNGRFGYTNWIVKFDPTKKPDGSSSGITDFVGTYSYIVLPKASDAIRSFQTVAQTGLPDVTGTSFDTPLPVPKTGAGGTGTSADFTTSTIPLFGHPNQTITGLSVTVNLTPAQNQQLHDGALTLTLIAPNSTKIVLYNKTAQQSFNPDNGAGFIQTTFTDSAAASIDDLNDGTYTGSYRPHQPLSVLNGTAVDGAYTLVIDDTLAGNVGVLQSWSLDAQVTAPASTQAEVNGNVAQQTYAAPMPLGGVSPTATTFPSGPYNQDTLPLIVPGPHVVSTDVNAANPGTQTSGDNLVLNTTNSILDVTFDRDMNPVSFTPAQILQIQGPAGRIDGPQRFTLAASNQNKPVPVGAAGPLLSTITVPYDAGTFPIANLDVQVNITDTADQNLSAFLVAPNGNRIELFANVGALQPPTGTTAGFTNTTFSDLATTPIASGANPFNGTFKPLGSPAVMTLSALITSNGKPIDLQGNWTLQLFDKGTASTATLNSWSLLATPLLSVKPIGDGATPGTTRTFQISFPQQSLSGTYTVQIASAYTPAAGAAPAKGIASATGDAIDTNLNAGLDVLRGGGLNGLQNTVPVTYSTGAPPYGTQSPLTIPKVGTVTSFLTVPDNFTILDPSQTANGLSTLTVNLTITDPYDPALSIYLQSPTGVKVPLFGVLAPEGLGPNTANITNTTFDDQSVTPIQNGKAPFGATFRPEGSLRSLAGLNAGGQWRLVITSNDTSGLSGTRQLVGWSLNFQKPQPITGLGEPVADQVTASFRIFNMDPKNPLASDTWTAVGPASIGGNGGTGPESSPGGGSGRIGGIAVDPSDPSGNTVFIGGASGGVWKTTNFLSTTGVTWIPLTDFGPTNAINVGGIAIFPRNNDPRQSIVIVATGEGDTSSAGVGFLRSMDGGATWTLLDSTRNVDAGGNELPINSALRDHVFVKGTTSFKVAVDPSAPNGQVIVYAAMSGANGGIWRSLDTGNTWQLMRAGQATDLALDLSSGTGTGRPGGTLKTIYAAFRGDGVYVSRNQAQDFSLMAGGVGNPQIFNDKPTPANVSVTAGPTPNGLNGRIVLATPALTGDPAKDAVYQGWLYAAVIGGDSHFQGLYLTKDFGANWTKVRIPTVANPPVGGGPTMPLADPTNDLGQADYDVGGGPPGTGLPAQGNYDVSLAIDPTNPNVVYLGGTADGQPTGFLRIDSSLLWDAHNTVVGTYSLNDGGKNLQNSTGPLTLVDPTALSDPTKKLPPPFLNFIPNAPVIGGPPYTLKNAANFTNNGDGARWIPFDVGGTDQHRLFTSIDPLTGHARLILGDDQGVFTTVDNNGTFDSGIGTAAEVLGSRNGNLQITQFYYGAAQPSNTAAMVAGALFYGSAQDNGGPASDPGVLTNGNITWGGPGGDATGVATDQQGTGTLFQYWWPCCGGNHVEFFQVNGVGKTNGLIQATQGFPTPDPQWPSTGGSNFAVNPIDSSQIIISSQAGRIFATDTKAELWFVIGEPSALDGSYAPALAFGAPATTGPIDPGTLDNFLYAGTSGGKIFLTKTGGGGAAGNQWLNISTGLDGSTVEQIVTDPVRGSRDAYAVTLGGNVYYIADSFALADFLANPLPPGPGVPTAASLGWQNITGNLKALTENTFGDPNLTQPIAQALAAIQVDWRYVIPANPKLPAGPNNPTHPVLYVGGNAGVFRSLDAGKTWSIFPNMTLDNSAQDGGYLPSAHLTALSMSLGNIDPNTGRAFQRPGDPNVLLATTYGRGSFAIKLAPILLPNTVQIDPASVAGTAPGGGPLVTTATPTFDGYSEQSAFGNTVRITILDLTDPLNPVVIGGYDGTPNDATDVAANQTDAFGHFSVKVNPTGFQSNGVKTIGIQATDASGTKGNIATISFTLNSPNLILPNPPTPPTLALDPQDDSGTPNDNITNVTRPRFNGFTDGNVQVTLLDRTDNVVPVVDPTNPNGPAVNFVTSDPATGAFVLQPFTPLSGNPAKVYKFRAQATNAHGSTYSPFVTVTIRTVGPAANTFAGLAPADDTGIKGDNITANHNPHFVGVTDPGALVDLINADTGATLVPNVAADPTTGAYSIQLPQNLTNGTLHLETRVHDVAGNQGPQSPPLGSVPAYLAVTIVSVLGDFNGDAKSDPALYHRNGSGPITWFINGVATASGISFGNGGTDIPFTGDFNGDGISDLAVYTPSTSIWTVQDLQVSPQGILIPLGSPTPLPLGKPGDVPVVGNFDGSGLSELGVYEPATTIGGTATWILNESGSQNGLQTLKFPANPGDVPVAGNYDGTGKDELAVYRPSTGEFLIAGPSSFVGANGVLTGLTKIPTFAPPNEVPVPGAYDALYDFQHGLSQRTEPAVFNPATGLFTILTPAATPPRNVVTVQFSPGDVPAVADYFGTGQDDPAVYRPSTNQFLDAGGVIAPPFAPSGEVPVLAPLVYKTIANATIKPTIFLLSADDSSHGQNVTNVTRPRIVGTGDPNILIDLIVAGTNTVLGTTQADANGNYTVVPTSPLSDGPHQLQVRARGLSGPALLSNVLSLTIYFSLQIVPAGTSPAAGSFNTALPGGVVVVKFNHVLAGLTADDQTGNSFANNPFALMLIPRGPTGMFGPPSGFDGGTLPVHGKTVYHVNGDGTSQLTFTPSVPLGTDVYGIQINVGDPAGNTLGGGSNFLTLEIKPTPFNPSPVQILRVTANNGATVINNNQIVQPDTIGIVFNKPMDFLTINSGTIQLVNATTGQTVLSAVTYSPSTNTAYLTPEDFLLPNNVYRIQVAGSVTDDTNFAQPGNPLGAPFFTSFTVANGPVNSTPPLQMTGTNPPNGFGVTNPIGYVTATFTERLNLNALGRFSVMLIPDQSQPSNTDLNRVPLNAKLAFNPNTNQLVIVPTVPLGNAVYTIALNNLTSTTGETLVGPSFSTFGLAVPGAQAQSVHAASVSSQSAPTSVASSPFASTTTVAAAAPTPPTRTASSQAHDQALAAGMDVRSIKAARRKAVASAAFHHLVAERASHKHTSHSRF